MSYDTNRIFNTQIDRKLWQPLNILKANTGQTVKALIEKAIKKDLKERANEIQSQT